MYVLIAFKNLFRYQTTGIRAFHRFSFVFLALGFAILLTASCSGTDDDDDIKSVVRTERLEIVDANGIPRVVLDILDDGRPSVILLDEQGAFRSWMFLSQDGSPNLVLLGNPRFALLDQDSKVRAALHLDSNGQPVLTLRDVTSAVRSELSLRVDGSPILRLYDANGEVIWTPLQEP